MENKNAENIVHLHTLYGTRSIYLTTQSGQSRSLTGLDASSPPPEDATKSQHQSTRNAFRRVFEVEIGTLFPALFGPAGGFEGTSSVHGIVKTLPCTACPLLYRLSHHLRRQSVQKLDGQIRSRMFCFASALLLLQRAITAGRCLETCINSLIQFRTCPVSACV